MLVSDRALHEEGKCHINKAGYNDITVIFKCKDKKSRFWKLLIKISCFGNRRKYDSSLTSNLFHKKKWGKLKLGGLLLYHLDLNLFIHGYLFVPLKFIVSFNHPHPSTLRHTHPSTLRYTHLPTLRYTHPQTNKGKVKLTASWIIAFFLSFFLQIQTICMLPSQQTI